MPGFQFKHKFIYCPRIAQIGRVNIRLKQMGVEVPKPNIWRTLCMYVPDGEERLLVVVRGDVEDEEVRPARRRREDPRLGVHPAPRVAVTALKL